MAVKTILSPQNETIKKAVKLNQKKYRAEFGMFIVEGERSVKEALASSYEIEKIIMTESFYDAHGESFGDSLSIVTTEKIFSTISDTKTPQGILAIVKTPDSKTLSGNRYIYCDCVQDPGNAGTIIRSADAFGFDGVIFSEGSVDVFSPKVIRASMGSVFHIAVMEQTPFEFLQTAKSEQYFITASALYGESVHIEKMKKKEKQIFVVGNEGNGVSEEILNLADEIVHIPMCGMAESLNVGVAASILMYEVSKHE